MIGAVVAFWAFVRWLTKRLTLYQTEWTIDFSDLEFLEKLNITETTNNREHVFVRQKLAGRKHISANSSNEITFAESKENVDIFNLKRFKNIFTDNYASNHNNNHTYIYPEDDLICDSCLNSSLSEVKLGSSVNSSIENQSGLLDVTPSEVGPYSHDVSSTDSIPCTNSCTNETQKKEIVGGKHSIGDSDGRQYEENRSTHKKTCDIHNENEEMNETYAADRAFKDETGTLYEEISVGDTCIDRSGGKNNAVNNITYGGQGFKAISESERDAKIGCYDHGSVEERSMQSINQRCTDCFNADDQLEKCRIGQDINMTMENIVFNNSMTASHVEETVGKGDVYDITVDEIQIDKDDICTNTKFANHTTVDALAFEDKLAEANPIKNIPKSTMEVTAVTTKYSIRRNTKKTEGRFKPRWSKDARCEGRSAFDKFTTTVARLHGQRVVSVRRVNKMRVKADFNLWMEMAEMKDMKHPNVATFIGAGPGKPRVFVVWEYCERGSLTDVIGNAPYRFGPLLQFSLAMNVTRGLAYIHKSKIITHGHLTSNNIVINKQWVAKITNFGLNKFKKGEKKRRSIDVLANATQMSELYWTPPESIRLFLRGKDPLQNKKKTDIYALGMIFKQIICRNKPYSEIDDTHTPAEIINKVGSVPSKEFRPPIPKEFPESQVAMAAFAGLTRKCWNDEPVLRPHAREVLDELKICCPFKEADIRAKAFTVMERYSTYIQDLIRTRRLQSEEREEAVSDISDNDDWDVKTELREQDAGTPSCLVDDYQHFKTTDKQGSRNIPDFFLRHRTLDGHSRTQPQPASNEENRVKRVNNCELLASSSSSFSIIDRSEVGSFNYIESIGKNQPTSEFDLITSLSPISSNTDMSELITLSRDTFEDAQNQDPADISLDTSGSISSSLHESDGAVKVDETEQDALNHSFTITPTIRGVYQHGVPVMKVIPAASVIVCSIVDFQRMACHHPPEKMLAILDDVTHQLDDITARHELVAVETSVGGYLAVGGCVTHRHDHAVVTAKAALSCLSIDQAAGISLQVRVGVGSGPVVIATVGKMAPRMCVMGGAVVTALRMEVTGLPLKIQACPNTHYFLKGNPAFTLKTRRLDLGYLDSNSKSFWIVHNRS